MDEVPLDELFLLGVRPLDRESHGAAVAEAGLVATERGRESLPADIRATVGEWLVGRFNQEQRYLLGPGWSGHDSHASDRVQVATSFAEAVLAVALWDQLREEDRDELLGPWAPFAD